MVYPIVLIVGLRYTHNVARVSAAKQVSFSSIATKPRPGIAPSVGVEPAPCYFGGIRLYGTLNAFRSKYGLAVRAK